MNGRGALAVHPLSVNGVERPGAIVLEAAAGAYARFLHGDRIKGLDGVQANICDPRHGG